MFLLVPGFQIGCLGWIIDGGGRVCVTRNAPNELRSPALSVSSTTKEMLDYLKENLGGSISTVKKYKESHKDACHWYIRCNKAIEILTIIEPYLLVPEKKKRAKLIIDEYKSVTPHNGKYSTEMLEKKLDFEKRFFEI